MNKVELMNDYEITLELNPTNFETKRLLDFKNSGINRLSIGVQVCDINTN